MIVLIQCLLLLPLLPVKRTLLQKAPLPVEITFLYKHLCCPVGRGACDGCGAPLLVALHPLHTEVVTNRTTGGGGHKG
ncbi:hypothetical protein T492DRAFT_1044430 [Pavlovales sp. CCMP2436]|nr:hypothetical protein T492DRAFT_1044430 [Pavlovales sp. CCMP2436]